MSELRVAWIGGATGGGGVGGFGRDLLRGLTAEPGVELTVFTLAEEAQVRGLMSHHAGDEAADTRLTVLSCRPRWEWGRWYSRHPMGVFLSSFWARKQAHARLIRRLVAEHRERPFDVVVQFSQIELFGLRKRLKELPPVLLFPCVHAAGELGWHRAEGRYARRSESAWRHWIVRLNLIQRAWLQRRDTRAVAGVIGMSRRFNELIEQDYGIEPARQAVVYQPMAVGSPQAPASESTTSGGQAPAKRPVRLLYVGRISVRKGIEMLVELSHRLNDLAGQVELKIIGGPSFWSDYSKHLADLNPAVGQWLGARPHAEVVEHMAAADALVVPSHYEPGGIVVAEALAQGCAVVVTDEVGSAEPVSGPACRRFTAGDIEAFECAVRRLVEEMAQTQFAQRIRVQAREQAAGCFDPSATRRKLMKILRLAAESRTIGEAETDSPKRRTSDTAHPSSELAASPA